MRNPNGYGCIKKLSGNRRRPYIFVVSETGRRRVIGYYSTQVEALIAQTDYNIHHNHPRLRDNKMTFSELYHRWLPDHISHYLYYSRCNRCILGYSRRSYYSSFYNYRNME